MICWRLLRPGIAAVVCLLLRERVSRKFLFRLFFLILIASFWMEMKMAIAFGFYAIPSSSLPGAAG
ncbi:MULTISPECIES: hypothetical protein [unclassified Mesorhizobium]|uniref:hypothetical protein n=1 Tax=unclassified Mesorhizobium TaxID=325217 RepID=UPI000BAFE3E9|nr:MULTISPECIES: hypothetical protein [unclassified Mesorhizobium]TGT63392.1 hypothetical protein EN813_008300 [Mesorhizobium sp. M00.F.Ca.ET.170.01.1.1]AZO11517.1 hypothetical protein EJ074_22275 [Mesorhizobium sp. M3A.F.Ca.ET.080.04.2.1]PBB88219.1 hypothetical protein CK216_00230 [Mesorhizobium sp. WSM3876]RWB67305.1 MAG: hypothetical protein EOQ49_26170 [Mesorhizobium sp.]RWB91981.1 MAG: hypothetical protein EOQ52_00240 [Mesorhizobium sp.]